MAGSSSRSRRMFVLCVARPSVAISFWPLSLVVPRIWREHDADGAAAR